MSVERHYFPGNNTPLGFFSYYRYILSQRDAAKIICIKGGPGSGKSTFLKKVGMAMVQAGENVDFLHCSADANSLDGILCQKRKIALVDGTSPHLIDPITPGAVDRIVDFAEFWDDKKIEAEKEEIIKGNEGSSRWYKMAYNYLAAAKNVSQNLSDIAEEGIEISEIYKLAADLIHREYKQYDICIKGGSLRRFFASAITPSGRVSHIKSLLQQMERIYLIHVPPGYGNTSFMNILTEGALYRGFDAEAYYCPMDPERKIEHLIVPDLKLAFVTTNRWHDLEPWEILSSEDSSCEIALVDINDYFTPCYVEKHQMLVERLCEQYEVLIDEGISALAQAKVCHDNVEKFYIKTMNFEKIDGLVEKTVKSIV